MTKALLAFFFILLLILPQIRGRFRGWDIANRVRGLDIAKCIVCQSTKSSSETLKGDESTRKFDESNSSAETGYPEGGELIGAIERVLFLAISDFRKQLNGLNSRVCWENEVFSVYGIHGLSDQDLWYSDSVWTARGFRPPG